MRRARAAAALLAGLLCAGRLSAHDFWIEPSSFQPAVGSAVEVRLRVGEHFAGDPVPRMPERLMKFALVSPSGESAIPGRDGGDPAGIARIAGPGLHAILYRSNFARLDLPAEKFAQYLAEEGLEHAIALRQRRGEQEKPSRERYSRSVKSLLAAGGDAAGSDHACGLTFELVAEKNPYRAAAGESLTFRLLHEGKPLPGALVVAVPKDRPDGKLAQRTDREGRVRLTLSQPGVWMVKSVHIQRLPDGQELDWESIWTSLTFELPPSKSAQFLK